MASILPPNDLSVVSSADGKSWGKTATLTNGWSDYGLTLFNFRGELHGIMVEREPYKQFMFITKYYSDGTWKQPWLSMPDKYKSQGRCAATVLDDRLYVAYRGTKNSHVYLIYTDDLINWTDVGRIGSEYAKSMVAPALEAYGGKLYLAGVGDDKYIYYTVLGREGQRLMSWTKIDGTGTQSALESNVYDGKLYLYHTAYNNGAFWYQTLNKGADYGYPSWSRLNKVETSTISSGVSVTTFKYNQQVATYRGRDNAIVVRFFKDGKWEHGNIIPGAKMLSQTGLGTWAGLLFVSFGKASGSSSYRMPTGMYEKSAFAIHEEEDDEWECKWKQQQAQKQKGMVQKFFCL